MSILWCWRCEGDCPWGAYPCGMMVLWLRCCAWLVRPSQGRGDSGQYLIATSTTMRLARSAVPILRAPRMGEGTPGWAFPGYGNGLERSLTRWFSHNRHLCFTAFSAGESLQRALGEAKRNMQGPRGLPQTPGPAVKVLGSGLGGAVGVRTRRPKDGWGDAGGLGFSCE